MSYEGEAEREARLGDLVADQTGSGPLTEMTGARAFRTLVVVLGLGLAAALALVSTHLDRGFDFSDEGVYFLNFKFPEEFPAGFTQYHLFGAGLYELGGGNLIFLRAVPWVGLLLATCFFGVACWRFVGGFLGPELRNQSVAGSFFLVLVASVFVSFSWPPPGVSYNSLADFGMLVAVGALLWAAAGQSGVGGRVLGMAGFAAGLVFLLMVKGSAAVGVGLFGGLFLFLTPTVPWRWKVGLLILGVLGIGVSGLILAFLAREQFFAVQEFFLTQVRNVLGAIWAGRAVDPLLLRHWEETWQLPWRMLLSYNFPIILGLGLGLVGRFGPPWLRPPSKWFVLALAGVFVALVASIYSKHGYLAGITHRHGSILAYTAILGLLVVLLPARAAGEKSATDLLRWEVGLLGGLLFVLPFVTAAGTTHRIYINALLHLGPYFALIALVGLAVAQRMRSWWPWILGLGLTVLVALSQFFHGGFFVPYRLPDGLGRMQEVVEIGVPPTRLRVDAETARFTREMQGLLNEAGFEPGEDLLAFFDMPGVVFAMGGKSPGRPWYFPNYGEQGERENLAALRIAGRERIARAIVLQSNYDPRVGEYLSTLDLNFPEDYEWVGETWQPYRNWMVTVWRPKLRDKFWPENEP
jgi:hypothetical protein